MYIFTGKKEISCDNGCVVDAEKMKKKPVLDVGFDPAILHFKAIEKATLEKGIPIEIAVEQADGSVYRFSRKLPLNEHPLGKNNSFYLERLVKFLLWSCGGYRIHVFAPKELVDKLKQHYLEDETGRFDARLMGKLIYEKPFEIIWADSLESLPQRHEAAQSLGRHLEGCRIGFDLGASDRKVAAVRDGEVIYSEEVPWMPALQEDPKWHFEELMTMLKSAASHLPRVDAIGGSAAGVYVNNRVQVASLFRSVPANLFKSEVKGIFLKLQKEWGSIPFEVVNDGEVTALAGAMSLNDNAVLGIALGSSEAVGYVTPEGRITSRLNELAFAPVDYREDAPIDEWSGDYGCGVQYFSQQAVGRLLKPAGIDLPIQMTLPEKLKEVQKLMDNGSEKARAIFSTIGTYLGYAVAWYAEFYEVKNILTLGRVTTGEGGSIILEKAREVLDCEFPDLSARLQFHTPNERDKRHGQAIAAASLPAIKK